MDRTGSGTFRAVLPKSSTRQRSMAGGRRQVEGSLEDVEPVVRLREYREGVFTGYTTPLTVTANGMIADFDRA